MILFSMPLSISLPVSLLSSRPDPGSQRRQIHPLASFVRTPPGFSVRLLGFPFFLSSRLSPSSWLPGKHRFPDIISPDFFTGLYPLVSHPVERPRRMLKSPVNLRTDIINICIGRQPPVNIYIISIPAGQRFKISRRTDTIYHRRIGSRIVSFIWRTRLFTCPHR